MSEVALTLRRRTVTDLTVSDRNINPQTLTTSGSGIVTNLILQGFGAAFDATAFLLYGLYDGGAKTYLDLPGILTLPRRDVALEVPA